MIKSEITKRSPLRILEKSIKGGLKKGEIAVLASRKGVGKTACLIHIAIDKLFQEKYVIHVSYASRVDYIINWYEDIFKEIAKKQNLKPSLKTHDEIIKNRVIMNFNQQGTNTEQVLKSVEAMIKYGQFSADTVIVDGFDFSKSNPEDLSRFRNFAEKARVEIWFSASLKDKKPLSDKKGYPKELMNFMNDIDVLITLKYQDRFIRLNIAKNRGSLTSEKLPLRLDPATFLIA
jgi:archaellum biogenesis ATPase FlaH